VVDNDVVYLTWTLNNITPRGVEVYRDTDPNPYGRDRIAWMRNGNAFIDEEATPGIAYYYWIKATESDWTVTNSPTVSATVPGGTLEHTSDTTLDLGSLGAVNIAPTATVNTSYVSAGDTLSAVNDNSNPSNSNDKSSGAYSNRDIPNSTQWVQYHWEQEHSLSSTEIYWFDDNDDVLVPTTAFVEYWDGESWINAGDLPLVKDDFNTLELNNIVTSHLRVSMRNPHESTGILEWRVHTVSAD
jgi:hypothetical protein